jgi:hypothetical protein
MVLSRVSYIIILFAEENSFIRYRKVCQNCRCGKAEHQVFEAEDPGFYFVGKLFDRPLRTKEEELEFCFGGESSTSSSTSDDEMTSSTRSKNKHRVRKTNNQKNNIVRVDWAPPNTSKTLVSELTF